MADIVLINPKFEVSYWGMEHAMPFFNRKALLPNVCLPLLAALTPPGHEVKIIDENVEEIDFDRCARADIVGVTGMNVQRRRMREILEELKRRDVFVVIGGPWVTIREDYFDGLSDAVFVGEADEVWPRFLEDWARGNPARRYEQSGRTDVTKLPMPRLDLLRRGVYAVGSVQFSRGCPFTCEFCDIIVVFGRRPRLKTPDQITAELDGLVASGARAAFVVDDNLIGDRRAMREILAEVVRWQRQRNYPLNLVTEASIDLADEPELLALMADANFVAVFVGIESPNEAALRETKKLQNLRKGGTMLEKVHRIQQAGIEVTCGMIVGFDSDDRSIFDAQRNFIRDSRIVTTMVNMLVAFPRTPLHERLKREGRLDEEDDFPVYGTSVIPLRMTRAELSRGYLGVMRDLCDANAYFARVDALFLDAGLRPALARRRFLAPWRRTLGDLRRLAEAGAILSRLIIRAGDRRLQHAYLGGLWRLFKSARDPEVLWLYAFKCAMHYHYQRMLDGVAVVNNF